jgi:hypothetical protein
MLYWLIRVISKIARGKFLDSPGDNFQTRHMLCTAGDLVDFGKIFETLFTAQQLLTLFVGQVWTPLLMQKFKEVNFRRTRSYLLDQRSSYIKMHYYCDL